MTTREITESLSTSAARDDILANWRQRAALRVGEFCAITGISPAAAYRLASEGELETVRVGKRGVRIPVSAVLRMLGETV